MRLLYYANGARYKTAGGEWVFRKWVEVPTQWLQKDLCISRHTVCKFRDELAKAGYIRYKSGDGAQGTEYMLCLLNGAQKPAEACQSLPKPTKQDAPTQGSFNTDDFWEKAVKASLGEDA